MVLSRRSAMLFSGNFQMSLPSNNTVPSLGRSTPEIMLKSVVLPLPEGPTMKSISLK